MPFFCPLHTVSEPTGTPIDAAIFVGAGAGIALAVTWNQRAIFSPLAPTAVAMLYPAYLRRLCRCW